MATAAKQWLPLKECREVNLPKRLSEVTPAAKPRKGGLCEHWGFQEDSEEKCSPEGKSRGSAAGTGRRFAAGSQPGGHWQQGQAARPCPQTSTSSWVEKDWRDALTLRTLYFFVNPVSTSKREGCIPSLGAGGTAKKCEINHTQH